MPDRVSRVVEELMDLLTGGKDDLAESAEVSYASLHAWSTGRRAPTRNHALILARVAHDRASRISQLAGLLTRYARTGRLTDEANPEAVPLADGPRLDPEQLRQIRERARLLQEKATETIEWLRAEETEDAEVEPS